MKRKQFDLFFPWFLALIAAGASLIFSEAAHLQPCKLCWYQRSMIFPLAIILGIAALRDAYQIIIYALPLAVIGGMIAAYQVGLILFFAQNASCPDCVLAQGERQPLFFPLLSLIAFVTLIFLLVWIHLRHKKSKKL